jgi:hypothetical protein
MGGQMPGHFPHPYLYHIRHLRDHYHYVLNEGSIVCWLSNDSYIVYVG